MSRVLVTGGSGFIGSHVVDALRRAGHTPLIYDLRPSPWHRDVETVIGDLADTERLSRALEGCEAIAHLAASADVDQVQKHPLEAEQANARGTASVLEAARRANVDRVVYASTVWVYSDVEGDFVDEDAALRPPSHLYTATKLAGELYCRSYAELYDLDYTILRFGIPYGPRARPAAVVPAMVGRALRGEPLTIAGDGLQTRRFVYVEDLAEGVVRGLAPVAVNRIYNLVSTEDVSIRRVAETVQAVVGDVRIEYGPGRSGDFGGVEIDGSRARAELGWEASTPFEEGVRRYVASVQQPAPVTPHLVVRSWPDVARRVISPVLLFGAIAACLGAAGSVDHVIDEMPVAALAMALALPLALVGTLEWSATARRRLGSIFWILTAAVLLALVVPLPGKGAVSDHVDVVLLLAASSATAAILAGGGPLAAWRERFSESG